MLLSYYLFSAGVHENHIFSILALSFMLTSSRKQIVIYGLLSAATFANLLINYGFGRSLGNLELITNSNHLIYQFIIILCFIIYLGSFLKIYQKSENENRQLMAKLDCIETYAPIAIFAFNRPNYLEACLTSLTKCEEIHRTEITVFIDKELNEEDEKSRNECIKIATNFKREMNLKIVCSETHKGLANSIINGINQIFNWSDKIIVVEDDLIVAPFFLKFCNDSLSIFADKDTVGAVCGYLPMSFDGRMQEPFFLYEFSSWGWATWKDRWKLFEHDAKKLLDKINDQGIKHYFDLDSTYPFTEMLRNQEMGK